MLVASGISVATEHTADTARRQALPELSARPITLFLVLKIYGPVTQAT